MIKTFLSETKKVLQEKFTDKENRNIKNLIKKVEIITNETPDTIIKKCDYISGHLTIERIEAIFGELRAVIFLNNLNFINIKLLQAKRKQKLVDIEAEIYNKKFGIEVTCLTKLHSRLPIGKYYMLDENKFLRTIITKTKEKKKQLQESPYLFKILILVLNRSPEKELLSKQDYEKILKNVYKDTKFTKNFFIGLITGQNNDDTIYPQISK